MNPFFLVCTILLFFLSPISAWHFQLTEGKTRCIYEEFPRNEIVRFDMKLLDQLTSDPKAGVYVEIKESATQTSVQKRLVPFNETTKMSFTSEKGGAYEICTYTSTGSHWVAENQKVRFELRVNYEVDPAYIEQNVSEAAKSEKMDDMYKTLRKLHAKTKHLVGTQENNREKEFMLFEDNSEINKKIMLCTLFQIMVIVISGVFQIYSLRAFLIKRDLY